MTAPTAADSPVDPAAEGPAGPGTDTPADPRAHAAALARAEAGDAALRGTRDDRWYPRFHVAAPGGWINDPNGLSHAFGRYQVFFQHHPFGTDWGPMHWGHVSSEDLVTWRREPIALAPSIPADRDGVFSGSAVVDEDGSLAVLYTGNRDGEGGPGRQVQCLATSADGVRFDKQGVVLEGPRSMPDFRDPKVWRQDGAWSMVVGARSDEGRGQVWLYRSQDLRDWTFAGVVFEHPDPDVFMIECPDLFPLGDRWVLVCCPMGLTGGGYRFRNQQNTGYVVGDLRADGSFTPLSDFRPLDGGNAFYAPQSLAAPDGRRILWGWMGAFDAALPPQAADGWCGQLTVPRELTLEADGTVRSTPIAELTRLRRDSTDLGPCELPAGSEQLLVEDTETLEIELELDLTASTAERVGLWLHRTPDGHGAWVGHDARTGMVTLDPGGSSPAASGDPVESGSLAGVGSPEESGSRQVQAVGGGTLGLRVFVDRGSIEVFVDGGREVLSSCSFPADGPRAAVLCTEAGSATITALRVHRLATIWQDA
jgi:beta-fructofuranosidase